MQEILKGMMLSEAWNPLKGDIGVNFPPLRDVLLSEILG